MPSRRRPLAAVAVVAVIVLVAGGWLLRPALAHPGEHFVAGGAGLTGSVSLQPGLMAGETAYADASGSCLYDAGRHVALVPVQVKGRGEGAMTLHVTATVAKQASGDEAIQTADTDIPYQASAHGHMGTWIQIPLDQAAWQAGATDCRVRWTMTAGAWFPNDD